MNSCTAAEYPAAAPALAGKIAVVTGASRGLGRAMALQLGAMGATVIVNHLQQPALALEVCQQIEQAGGEAYPLQADVTDMAQTQEMMMAIYQRHHRIDILINNAGVTRDNYLVMMTQKAWDDVINVNLNGTYHAMKAVIRFMAGKRSGVIINIGSGAGLVAMPGQVNYSAAKAAILGLTRSVAREVATKNVRVINVAPGFFNTDMTKTLSQDFIAETLRLTPLARWGDSDELVALVCFLVTDAAAGFTGHTLIIDGGRGAQEREFGLK